jgi:hypothetical protein
MHSFDALDLSQLCSMAPLIAGLHSNLRMITTPLSYEQLQKNENVLL